MAPMNNLAIVAFASAAFAVPHAQWQPFKRHAHPQAPPAYGSSSTTADSWGSSSAPAAPVGTGSSGIWSYPAGNSTAPYGSGSGVVGPTGYSGTASTSVCTETSTLIYRSSTEYSTYYVTHTVTPSEGTSAPVGPATTSALGGGYPTETGPAPVGPATETAPAGGDGSCTPDVTVTTTEKTTVYVTAGAGSSASEASAVDASSTTTAAGWSSDDGGATPSAYSSADGKVYSGNDKFGWPQSYYSNGPHFHTKAPASTESAVSSIYNKGPHYHKKHHHHFKASPSVATTAPGAPETTTTPSAPETSTYAPAPSPVTSETSTYAAPTTTKKSKTSAPSPTAAPTGGAFKAKGGLAYNDASLCDAFSGASNIGWAYNWGSDSGGFSGDVPYIPMLWGDKDGFPEAWNAAAQSAIDNGAEYLFSMNEPDNAAQANMMPADAATFWKQYMEPFAGKAKLVAPSITNGNGPGTNGGLPGGTYWLSEFLEACDGCTIDAVNQHWYDYTSNDAGNFKDQYTNASSVAGGKPVFISEFGAIGSDSDISDFLNEVMPEMDNDANILGYAYFMVSDGLLVSGDSLTSYGATFAGSS